MNPAHPFPLEENTSPSLSPATGEDYSYERLLSSTTGLAGDWQQVVLAFFLAKDRRHKRQMERAGRVIRFLLRERRDLKRKGEVLREERKSLILQTTEQATQLKKQKTELKKLNIHFMKRNQTCKEVEGMLRRLLIHPELAQDADLVARAGALFDTLTEVYKEKVSRSDTPPQEAST